MNNPELNLISARLLDSSFETKKGKDAAPGGNEELSVKFDYQITKDKISGDETDGVFESLLRGTLIISNKGGEELYISEATFQGIVKVKNLTKEQLEFVLNADLVSQLEPSVKAYINQSLSTAGLPPFHRVPFNFIAHHEEQKKRNAQLEQAATEENQTIQ